MEADPSRPLRTRPPGLPGRSASSQVRQKLPWRLLAGPRDPVRQAAFAVVIERRTRLRSKPTEQVDEVVAVQAWTEAEYEAIFQDHPPTQPTPPSRSECESLAAQLGRSPEAISAQWDDGRSLVLGQKTAASARLGDYLARHGWL